jgi:ATP:ADP antiporter, AAA family
MSIASGVSRWFDVRRDEVGPVVRSFLVLLLLIAAHTVLETARDALLLARFPARALGLVYVVTAVSVLPFAMAASRLTARFGPRRVLTGGLLATSLLVVTLFALHTHPVTVVAIYVVTGLVGGSLVPLFWNAVGGVFTVTEGRRLLGIIGAAGVLGGVIGSTAAAALLTIVRVKALLPVSAVLFVAAAAVVVLRGSATTAPSKTLEGNMLLRAEASSKSPSSDGLPCTWSCRRPRWSWSTSHSSRPSPSRSPRPKSRRASLATTRS